MTDITRVLQDWMNSWEKSALETPRLVYTRRWERWLAIVWPPKRRRLALMNKLAGLSAIELQRMRNKIQSDLTLYGTSMAHLLTETPDTPSDQEASQKRSNFTGS